MRHFGLSGLLLAILGCSGLLWVALTALGCSGLLCVALGCSGLLWAALCVFSVFWNVLGLELERGVCRIVFLHAGLADPVAVHRREMCT